MRGCGALRAALRAALLAALLAGAGGRAAGADGDAELYYYGLEESERGLAACGARQACGARLRRAWRPPALLRLCRCGRRRACAAAAPPPPATTLEINNGALLQFCDPVTDWPRCAFNEAALTVETSYERMDPDELEEMHHKNIQLTPPNITLTCRCPHPNHWRAAEGAEGAGGGAARAYRCGSLPPCDAGDHCGNVNYGLDAVYQSCSCPARHMCVHGGGLANLEISELLYRGRGWRAYCQPLPGEHSYEDY